MAQGQRAEDSVYDFLYVDARRIAVFLSQFEQYGHLTALTRSASETSTSGGGLSAAVVKLDTAAAAQTSLTRQFDPQWLAPLTFLDQASQRGMIMRDLSSARIGQLVLISGRLAIFDLGVMRSAWEISAVKSAIVESTLSQAGGDVPLTATRNAKDRQRLERARREEAARNINAGLEFLKLLPHAIQASIQAGQNEVWASLRGDNLIVPASELLIKHGHVVAGEWNVVGVLDALPDDAVPEGDSERFLAQMTAALALGALAQAIAAITPIARTALGRPSTSYGMTPLLIFREVAA